MNNEQINDIVEVLKYMAYVIKEVKDGTVLDSELAKMEKMIIKLSE